MDNKPRADQYKTCGPEATAREKTWDECQIEERLERLRREVRMLLDSLDMLHRSSSRNAEILRRHSHGQHGEVLVLADMVGDRIYLDTPGRRDSLK